MKKNQLLNVKGLAPDLSSGQMFCIKKSCKSGFSLVEVLVAMFVFTLVMSMLAGSFSGFLKNYANTKKSQKSIENAQFIMNQMEQVFLSSSHVSINNDPDGNSVIDDFQLNFYNTINSSCVVYYFDSSAKSMLFNSEANTDPNTCTFSVPTNVLLGNSVVGFSAFGNQVKITFVFKIQESGQREATIIQSTALSRNAWINNGACDVEVLASDVTDPVIGNKFDWGPGSSCIAPQCLSNNLVGGNTVDFLSYPARKICQKLGGRLPDSLELECMLENQAVYGGHASFSGKRYWSSEETASNKATSVLENSATSKDSTNKNQANSVRCVK